MEFIFTNEDDVAAPADTTNAALIALDDDGPRELGVMLAEDDARLESRVWQTDDQSDSPRIYYISGTSLRYDNQHGDAAVDGAGEMLIRDLQASDEIGGDDTAPFSAQGTSRFRWKTNLTMVHAFGDRYDITMSSDVEVVHRSLLDEITTVTGDRLGLTMLRQSVDSDTTAADTASSDALSFGGDVDVRRLWGEGRIFVRTPEREVECDRFDYNRYTDLARLEATGNRRVTIKSRGSTRPVQAEVILWNLRDDSLTIERAGS